LNDSLDKTQLSSQDAGATQQLGPDLGKTAAVTAAGALALQIIPGNKYALATEHSREHFLLLLTSGAAAGGRRPPLNICLLIDRSGSMEGEPLDYVKRAASYVVDLMDQNDILSIVAFAEDVQVIMPARRVVNKQLIKEHINRLQVKNTTNIYDALVVAGQQVGQARSNAFVNRILFLSDGDPTTGIKDFGSIVAKAAESKDVGITITALGFGPEYNEELIAGIARRCGGNYYYISRPDLIPEVFRRELDQLMTVTAQNLRLTVALSKWVRLRQVYGSQPTLGSRSATVQLADLERGAAMSRLLELEFEPRRTGTYRVAKIDVAFEDLSIGRPQTVSADAVIEFTADRELVEANVDQTVQREIEVAQAARNLEKTMMGLKTQAIAAQTAMMELQQTKTMLLSQGRTAEASQVDEAISALQKGGADAEKTLIGTIMDLDVGKKK
jgi:Ca-activated chloride channel family protein